VNVFFDLDGTLTDRARASSHASSTLSICSAYLIGGYVHFLVPALLASIQPIHIVAVVAEVGLCGWLLLRGVDVKRWEAANAALPV